MSSPCDDHVTDQEIALLVNNRLEAGEAARILGHLVRCRPCGNRQRPKLRGLSPAPLGVEVRASVPGLPEDAYDLAIDRALAKARDFEPRREAEDGWRVRLVEVGRSKPPFRLGEAEGFDLFDDLERKAPLVSYIEALLELSSEARYRDPQAMLHTALGAVLAARTFVKEDDAVRPRALRTDLHARALGELANAQRRNDQFEEANETLLQALELLEKEGTGDVAVHTRLLDVLASLRIDQRILDEANDLLDEVHERYRELSEAHLAGRALIKKGYAAVTEERYDDAAALYHEGLAMIERDRDPQLADSARFNLLVTLVESGRFTEASRALLRSGIRQAFADEPLKLTRLRWLEGRIFVGLGKTGRGELILKEAREAFVQGGWRYEAAVVDLELTTLFLRLNREADAEASAAEALATFRAIGVPSEAERAVRYLRQACSQRKASPAMAENVLRFMRRVERNPLLRFAM